MREVVLIGGGLSGLVAANELEKAGISYTLIEVKNRLGGSIESVNHDGFVFDAGPMCHAITDLEFFTAYLRDSGLYDEAVSIGARHTSPLHNVCIFKHGTAALTDALAAKITAPRMMRMAVSTLGQLDAHRFSICLENGIMLDAKALIVAAPARYAERMFHTLKPEISFRLLDYRYDTITRVSVGYGDSSSLNTAIPPDYPIAALQSSTERGPGLVLQAALRFSPQDLPDDPVGELAALMDWPLNPSADHIATWTESDPIMWRDPQHPQTIQYIQGLLPPGVALIGSDYIPTNEAPRLDERIKQSITMTQAIIHWLKK